MGGLLHPADAAFPADARQSRLPAHPQALVAGAQRRAFGAARERAACAPGASRSHAVVNLLTFLFIVTGFVYTFFFIDGAGIEGYVDALYFTVATITTTGFGDIVLPGIAGKLTSIVTMIIGISLFVKLAQAIFRPAKVFFECPHCALQRHEPDAVHCKACGRLLKIPDDGG